MTQTTRAKNDRTLRTELHLALATAALQAVTRLPGRGAGKARTAAKDALRLLAEQDTGRLASVLELQRKSACLVQVTETGVAWGTPNDFFLNNFKKPTATKGN